MLGEIPKPTPPSEKIPADAKFKEVYEEKLMK